MALELNKNNIDQVLTDNVVTLVDFYATWCGPCRMVSPIIDALASENEGIAIGKMDVDDNQEVAQKYGVRNIPTLLFFKNGEVVNRKTGVVGKDELQTILNTLTNETDDNQED